MKQQLQTLVIRRNVQIKRNESKIRVFSAAISAYRKLKQLGNNMAKIKKINWMN